MRGSTRARRASWTANPVIAASTAPARIASVIAPRPSRFR